MARISKLLDKPFKAFTAYALIVLICSIPAYYLVVNYIWMEELDEHNQIIKERFKSKFDGVKVNEEELSAIIYLWNKLQPGTTLRPLLLESLKADSVYFTNGTDENLAETDRFRALSTVIQINNKPYQLVVETSVEEVDETFFAIALVTFLFFAIIVVGFILLNRKIAQKIWQPFRKTLDVIKSFDLNGGKPVKFEQSEIEEFEELNGELSSLIAKNVMIYNQQKIFIENASHELQTPLAILRSKLDVLLQSENLSQEQSEIIHSIAIPLGRVTRLNKNLLLLAKIENAQFGEAEELNVATVINENIELLSDYSNTKSLSVLKDLNEVLIVSANKTVMEVLINNLLINAINHSAENTDIQIYLRQKKLMVQNRGENELNVSQIFDRFSMASTKKSGSGLGLAIVKEIAKHYGWQMEYLFKDNWHIFSIQF